MLKRLLIASAAFLFASSSTIAQVKSDSLDALKAKLSQTIGLEVTAIGDAPVKGLYQVNTNRGLFYVSEDGTYFLQARIYNIDEGMRNETEATLSGIRMDGIGQFDDSAIVFKAKNEKSVITVFTDITCGYCRKLHNEIGEFNDMGITVKYLAFPRQGLASSNYNDMVSVWCAKNPQAALTDAKSGTKVSSTVCENQVAAQYEFGQQVGVSGTPNIILPDGSMIPGYQPAKAIAQQLGI